MKSFNKFITEAMRSHYDGLTVIHFESASAAFLYKFELEGQISDGKYENSRPASHWLWVTNTEVVIDGHAYYEELSADKSHIQHYRQRLKDYNLKEWPGYIESGKDDWAKRVLGYGRLGRVLERKETLLHQLINEDNAEYIGYMVEYDWVQGAEKNTPFEELSHRYDNKVDSNICNKKVYDEFCKTEYTIRDLKNDLRSMAESVNTPQEEY